MNANLALDAALARTLGELIAGDGGSPAGIDRATTIGGGSISRALRVDSGQRRCFVKLNDARLIDMFAAEADGLQALASCSALHIPRVIGQGVSGRQAYLVLEHLSLHSLRQREHATTAGRALAQLHRVQGQQYGWQRDNYIGSTPQRNASEHSWPAFFAHQRLLPQLELAKTHAAHGQHGKLIASGERLAASLSALLPADQPPASLLHGDLWSGNAAIDDSGMLVLFDPAVHFGDRECDLAMSKLFGGFPDDFYAAYREAWPLSDGYQQRQTLYQLYHVLNHLNLFGSGYLHQAETMIASLLAELGH